MQRCLKLFTVPGYALAFHAGMHVAMEKVLFAGNVAGGGRVRRGGAGPPPFYVPRCKTSAEIVSEARAAVLGDGDKSTPSTGLRALGTRRPYTPRDAQRTLFARGERTRPDRPPSALNMRHVRLEATGSSYDDTSLQTLLLSERPANIPSNDKMAQRRSKSFHQEESLPLEQNHRNMKLPQLTGQAKPLHRRTLDPLRCLSEENQDTGYESTIDRSAYSRHSQSGPKERTSADAKRAHFSINKSRSVDSEPIRLLNNTSLETSSDKAHSDMGSDFDSSESNFTIRKIAVQIPSPSSEIDHGNFEEEHSTLHKPKHLPKNPTDPWKKYSYNEEIINKNWSRNKILVKTTSDETITKSDEKRLIYDLLENLTLKQDSKYHSDEIVELLPQLYDLLDGLGLWHSMGGKVKTAILETLYRHVESDDDRILMSVAKIFLAMRVTGTHLSAVFKLIFKVARSDQNDYLFKTGNILELLVEGMGRACPLSEPECCVYAGGVLRFVSLDAGLRDAAQRAGAVHLLALHLKLINNAKAESPRSVSEQTSHALYQLTGALRHLAEPLPCRSASSTPESPLPSSIFVSSGALEQLCKTLDLFITDLDVLTNVTRTLSVLSAESACCVWLGAHSASCGAALRALAAAASRPALAVRLTYALGNVAAYSDEGRMNIYSESGSIDCLLTVMEIYLQLCTREPHPKERKPEEDAELFLVGSDLAGSSGSNEDVLVKTIRVLANICMNASAGLALARSDSAQRACRCLLAVARLPPVVARPDATPGDQELPAAALAAINNLSYYHDGEEGGPFDDIMWELCDVSCRHVSRGGSAGAEAVRALGNLSRSHLVRDQLLRDHTHVHAVAAYLHDEDSEVRHAAAGVVVNVCGGGGAGGTEGKRGCVSAGVSGGKCLDSGVGAWSSAACGALVAAARLRDYRLGALLTRALWNVALRGALDVDRARGAAELLDQMIDDEQIFAEQLTEDDPDYENLESEEREPSVSSFAAWEDFATVAIALLDRLGPAVELDHCQSAGDIREACVSTDSRDLVQI